MFSKSKIISIFFANISYILISISVINLRLIHRAYCSKQWLKRHDVSVIGRLISPWYIMTSKTSIHGTWSMEHNGRRNGCIYSCSHLFSFSSLSSLRA